MVSTKTNDALLARLYPLDTRRNAALDHRVIVPARRRCFESDISALLFEREKECFRIFDAGCLIVTVAPIRSRPCPGRSRT